MRFWRRRATVHAAAKPLLVVALISLVTALVAQPALAASVDATRIGGGSNKNKTCEAVFPDFETIELKKDLANSTAGVHTATNGTLAVDFTIPSTLAPTNPNSLDFAARPGTVVYGTIVKDGTDGANFYDYRPNGTTSDLFLTTPFGGRRGISHVSFCVREAPVLGDPLTVSKTVDASYDRTVTWSLVKTVDDDSHEAGAGELAGSSIWDVEATKSEVRDNHIVTGDITITNTNDFEVPFTVTDTLSDDTVAAVTCLATAVPANGSTSCSYAATPADGSATSNTAVVTSLLSNVAGATTTEPVVFVENLTGDDTVTLADARFQHTQSISATTTVTFPEAFTCSDDPADYTDGLLETTETNTATLTGPATDLSDTADVVVTCTLAALTPSKTAAGTYDETITWTLDKSVDQASHTGDAGETAGSSTWTVTATKTETVGNYLVTGTITVVNSSSIDQTFTVTDVLNDAAATVAEVTCPTYTAQANTTVTCTYEANPTTNTATLNTATISMSGNADQVATAPVTWTATTAGDETVTLDDERSGYTAVISTSTTVTFPESFPCSNDPADYTNGQLVTTETNTATLTGDDTDLSDSADVRVTCTLDALDVAKTAAGTFDRTIDWDLAKSASPTTLIGKPGQELTTDWTVTATKAETLSNFAVTGTITITNSAAIAQTFSVSDILDDGTVAAVSCPTSTVPADGSVTCAYVANPDDDSATENTVTVSAPGNAAQSATVAFAWSSTDIGDEETQLTDTQGPLGETLTDSETFTYPGTFVCPSTTEVTYVDDTYEFTVTNIATLTGPNTNEQAQATVTIQCVDVQRPSIQIGSVTITSASKDAGTAAGTFVISNQSGGDVTYVTLGTVTVSFIAKGQGGAEGTYSASCTVTPEATGAVLAPHEHKEFAFSCTDLTLVSGSLTSLADAHELTAVVEVDGAWNQVGEFRDRVWRATSSPYKL